MTAPGFTARPMSRLPEEMFEFVGLPRAIGVDRGGQIVAMQAGLTGSTLMTTLDRIVQKPIVSFGSHYEHNRTNRKTPLTIQRYSLS